MRPFKEQSCETYPEFLLLCNCPRMPLSRPTSKFVNPRRTADLLFLDHDQPCTDPCLKHDLADSHHNAHNQQTEEPKLHTATKAKRAAQERSLSSKAIPAKRSPIKQRVTNKETPISTRSTAYTRPTRLSPSRNNLAQRSNTSSKLRPRRNHPGTVNQAPENPESNVTSRSR
jgi:hypothetical protein